MTTRIDTDICVIGAGSGGLSVAAGASQMGADTVLIERGKMGGDCLNTGCVPSKALIAAAQAAHDARRSSRFGITVPEPEIDFARVNDHVHGVIGAIEPMDSVERFEGMGVRVISAAARFTGPRTVQAGEHEVHARRIVIATGSRPAVPPIDGLADVPYLTNETIFENRNAPAHLVIIGGGPIGLEMAQAHRRLGSRVTVVEQFSILPKDDDDLVETVRRALVDEGVDLREGAKVGRVERTNAGAAVVFSRNGVEDRVEGSHLLVAVGRRANIESLDLPAAGISVGRGGIDVDRRLRTSNRHVFVIGDAAGGPYFTHLAGYHASIVVKNALFRIPAKADTRALPWVTFTDPELAQVGLTEAQARERHSGIRTLRWSFHENDRAQAERQTEGTVKAITTRRGKVLGASIVGPHAGELILPWVLAVSKGLKIGALATLIAPYPTLSEVTKRAAGSFYTPSLFSDRTAKIVRFLARFG